MTSLALAFDGGAALDFILLRDPNARWVLGGSFLTGLAGGILGAFALLRRQALLGDALAHAALPGICLAFLAFGSKAPGVLLAGALASGVLGTLAIGAIVRAGRIKPDAAMGIVLSVTFGLGIALLTAIQRRPDASQAGLERFLFGQAASMLPSDLAVMAPLTLGIALAIALLFKEWRLVSFDPGYAAAIGRPVRALDTGLTFLIALAVVLGLSTSGVVLVVAMLVTPAAAARQWTDRLAPMVVLAGAIGALSGASGAFVSSLAPKLPTGPLSVLVATGAFVVSALLAPERGVLARALQARNNRRRVRRENILKTLYLLDERAPADAAAAAAPAAPTGSHACLAWTPRAVAEARGARERGLGRELASLAARGLVEARPLRAAPADGPAAPTGYALSAAGLAEARRVVRAHRLWELYLVHRAELQADHVHRDAEAIEHLLPPELLRELEERLAAPATDPHGRPIPGARPADAVGEAGASGAHGARATGQEPAP